MKKLFRKKATITTSNNDKYLLESHRVFIMPHRGNKRYRHKYGNLCSITKLDENNSVTLQPNDQSFIGKIYSFDDSRLRFLLDTYKDAKSFDTEMHDNGKELPITVIETYTDKTQCIASIGDIVQFDSDIEEQSIKFDIKILKLLREKSNKKDL